MYSYVIEVADSDSDLGYHAKALVSEIFAFYHLEYARGRPRRRGHVHLGQNFFMFLRLIRVYEGFEGFYGFVGFEGFKGFCNIYLKKY